MDLKALESVMEVHKEVLHQQDVQNYWRKLSS